MLYQLITTIKTTISVINFYNIVFFSFYIFDRITDYDRVCKDKNLWVQCSNISWDDVS